MQNKELHFVVQKLIGLMRIKGTTIPQWSDLDLYPCGLRTKNFHIAKNKAEKSLYKFRKKGKGTYRIIKRYIPIPENDLQLHLELK